MTVFDPVEAQQHITEARKAATAVYIAVEEPVARDLSRILTGLAADLESAVEYIAGEDARVMGLLEGLVPRTLSKVAVLEAEVARLNKVIVVISGDMHLTQMTPNSNDPGAYVLGATAEKAIFDALTPVSTEPESGTVTLPYQDERSLMDAVSRQADAKLRTEPEKEN